MLHKFEVGDIVVFTNPNLKYRRNVPYSGYLKYVGIKGEVTNVYKNYMIKTNTIPLILYPWRFELAQDEVKEFVDSEYEEMLI